MTTHSNIVPEFANPCSSNAVYLELYQSNIFTNGVRANGWRVIRISVPGLSASGLHRIISDVSAVSCLLPKCYDENFLYPDEIPLVLQGTVWSIANG